MLFGNFITSIKQIFTAYSNGSPANGEQWYDGTNHLFREGNVTKLLTATDATITTSDITTNNFTTSKHGFVPKGTNLGKFLKDDGTWGVAGTYSNISATLSFDFGTETDNVTTTVSNANLTDANFVNFAYRATTSGNTYLDDFGLNEVTFTLENIIDNTSFDIRATAQNNASGSYQIKYFILYS